MVRLAVCSQICASALVVSLMSFGVVKGPIENRVAPGVGVLWGSVLKVSCACGAQCRPGRVRMLNCDSSVCASCSGAMPCRVTEKTPIRCWFVCGPRSFSPGRSGPLGNWWIWLMNCEVRLAWWSRIASTDLLSMYSSAAFSPAMPSVLCEPASYLSGLSIGCVGCSEMEPVPPSLEVWMWFSRPSRM